MVDDFDEFISAQKRLELNGLADSPLNIAYTDVGTGDPIILLHGIPTWSYLYHEVIPILEPPFIGFTIEGIVISFFKFLTLIFFPLGH